MEQGVIITKHHKEKIIAPILEKKLKIKLTVFNSYDTDKLGTFTNEIKRRKNQLETLKRKAQIALAKSHATIAVASEGSFYPHHFIPGLYLNTEMVILIDKSKKIEVIGKSTTHKVIFHGTKINTIKDLKDLIEQCDFPNHGIILKTTKFFFLKKYYKEIQTKKELLQIAESALKTGCKLEAFTDQRAHRNPTRQENIALATEDLVKRYLGLQN